MGSDAAKKRRRPGRTVDKLPAFAYPPDAALAGALRSAAALPGERTRAVTTIERRRNEYGGSFPSEVVTLKFGREPGRPLFLKYDAPVPHTGHGYWGSVAYEAGVYKHFLAGHEVPRFLGYHRLGGASCMALEFVENSLRLELTTRPNLVRSARWLGAFHAAFDGGRPLRRTLHRYDAAYFLGWAKRTLEYARPLLPRYPWLPRLVEAFAESARLLATSPRTLVHGEFYPKNILIAGEAVLPVDWQSAAAGPGEIDLASLTEGWKPRALVARCEREYIHARWPQGAPWNFQSQLAAARLYWPFRWLGDRPSFTLSPGFARYFGVLKAEAKLRGFL